MWGLLNKVIPDNVYINLKSPLEKTDHDLIISNIYNSYIPDDKFYKGIQYYYNEKSGETFTESAIVGNTIVNLNTFYKHNEKEYEYANGTDYGIIDEINIPNMYKLWNKNKDYMDNHQNKKPKNYHFSFII